MKEFLDEKFLLDNKISEQLYHTYAADLPIIDFHCHLPPHEISEDKRFENITEIWLGGDHYKWRAMRALGVPENHISGDASPRDKFNKWAGSVPLTIRNPLYHWSHLELRRYFGIDDILSPDTANNIYDECNRQLNAPGFSVRSLLTKMKVEVVCTTDDPKDALKSHSQLRKEDTNWRVFPTFRPDNVLKIGMPDLYLSYLKDLGLTAGKEIGSWEDLLIVLENRIDYFNKLGCRLSDHGLDYLHADDFNEKEVSKNFHSVLNGRTISFSAAEEYRSAVLFYLARLYHKYGWTQQYHLGALRNTNDRLAKRLGADCGADSINDGRHAMRMAKFFNHLDRDDKLARTIIYNLNPADNEVFASMIGNYNDGTIAGKMQFGSGWWFLDQKDGIEKQLNSLSNLGMLSQFVGMVTDSRSFLSYPRHEYFRRILCNLIGKDVVNGELPNDLKWLGKIVSDISYHNARKYFEFEK